MTFTLTILGRLFFTLIADFLYAPIWWYTSGVVWIMRNMFGSIQNTARDVGLGVWVKNIFVPMYGQYDAWGRVVSFIVRVANIVARFFWVLIWAIICFAVIVIWFSAPPVIFYELLTSGLRLFS
ncbi:MAG: hypothetical protein NT003_05140 [Candidatus Magasanikbacteria bacterium]|nr:hypothetical protein [Candidatus Magasanikbacteria bacterium]